jgi:hypothetical protein
LFQSEIENIVKQKNLDTHATHAQTGPERGYQLALVSARQRPQTSPQQTPSKVTAQTKQRLKNPQGDKA